MNQMTVAMVDEMEDVELVSNSPQDSRILYKTVQHTVNIESRSAGEARKAAQPRHKGRAYKNRFDIAAMMQVQIFQQHFADQIHAWPAFLEKVAYHSDTKRFHNRGRERATMDR